MVLSGILHVQEETLFASVEAIIAALAVILAGVAVQASVYIRRSEFEDIYIQRYWEILNRIPVNLRVQLIGESDLEAVFERDAINGAQVSSEEQALWDYLALCEDEIDLRKIGRVTDETWVEWCASIETSIGGYPYRNMLEHIMKKLNVSAETLQTVDPTLTSEFNHLPFSNLRYIYYLQSQEDGPKIAPLEWPTRELGITSWARGRRQRLFGKLEIPLR